MPIAAALIGVGGGIVTSLIGGSTARDVAQIGAVKDTRTTALDELFSESFLSSLTSSERSALEEQTSTGTLDAQSFISERERVRNLEDINQFGTEDITGITTGDTTSQRGSIASAQALQDIIQGGSQPDGGAAIQASIDRVLRSGAPVVSAAGNRAGAFDSTVQAQLANDLIVKAAEAGALTDLQQQNTNTQNLLAAIAASQTGQETVQSAQENLQSVLTNQQTLGQTSTVSDTTRTEQQQQQTAQQSVTAQQEAQQVAQEQQQQQVQVGVTDTLTDVDTIINPFLTPQLGESPFIAADRNPAAQSVAASAASAAPPPVTAFNPITEDTVFTPPANAAPVIQSGDELAAVLDPLNTGEFDRLINEQLFL